MKSAAEKECYRLIQQIAVLNDPICTRFGCWKPSVVGHHIFPRSRMATAFDPRCVLGKCDCHHKIAHSSPAQDEIQNRKRFGDEEYEALERLSWTVVPDINFEEIRDGLKKILDKGKDI